MLTWDGIALAVPVFASDPPELAQAFEEKWKIRVTRKKYLQEVFGMLCLTMTERECGILTTMAADVHTLLTRSRKPKLQQLKLLDLPPEILYQCIEAAELRDTRSLSATCQRLRVLASPYIFKVCKSRVTHQSRMF